MTCPDHDLRVKVIWGVAQYPLHHVTYAPEKIEVATSNSLGGDAFTRKYIIWSLNLTLGSWSHEMSLSTFYIMWPMHLQSLKLLRQTVSEKIQLQEMWQMDRQTDWRWTDFGMKLIHPIFLTKEQYNEASWRFETNFYDVFCFLPFTFNQDILTHCLQITLQTDWTQIRPDKIWIQSVWHSDGIPQRILKKIDFEKKQMTKKHEKLHRRLVCLIWFFIFHQQSFSWTGTGLPGLNQY